MTGESLSWRGGATSRNHSAPGEYRQVKCLETFARRKLRDEVTKRGNTASIESSMQMISPKLRNTLVLPVVAGFVFPDSTICYARPVY